MEASMTTQTAAVYSQPLMALLAEGEAPVDRIVVCPWHTEAQIEQAKLHRPLLLHSMPASFTLSHPDPFDDALMAQTEKLLTLTDSSWLSTGLGFSIAPSERERERSLHPEVQPRGEVYLNTCRNAMRLKQRLPVPLLLENADYHASSVHTYICEPLFTVAVLDAVNCDFLLNVAHARVSARSLGFHQERYFRSLPLFRARAVCVSGSRLQKEATANACAPPEEQDWQALTFVLARTQPEVVMLGYTQDENLLREHLQRLRHML
jgi:uncharacterized protein (UPF0276 family)